MPSFPRLSFLLFSYNQSASIIEALRGATSQTYPNLEIIFSDDCSPDDTYEIGRSFLKSYNGPHTIRLNKNEENLGISRHVKHLLSKCTGQWALMAAGDDVSLPNRASRTYEISISSPNARAICFPNSITNQQDPSRYRSVLPSEFINNGLFLSAGATFSYHRDCFFWPTPYPEDCWYEDRVLPFRASILGDLIVSNDVAVDYRQGISEWRERVDLKRETQKTYQYAEETILRAQSDFLISKRQAQILMRLLAQRLLLRNLHEARTRANSARQQLILEAKRVCKKVRLRLEQAAFSRLFNV
jgi:glycosyltransferase involved in cell wall biosynthesis